MLRENFQYWILYLVNLLVKTDAEMKTISDKEGEITTNKSLLKALWEEALQEA